MLRFWNRLLSLPTDRLTRLVFEQEFRIPSNYNWCGDIEKILELINQSDYFHNKTIIDLDMVHTLFCNQMLQDFSNDVVLKPKLRSYKLFKNNMSTELYVAKGLNRQERSSFAQLHYLRVSML